MIVDEISIGNESGWDDWSIVNIYAGATHLTAADIFIGGQGHSPRSRTIFLGTIFLGKITQQKLVLPALERIILDVKNVGAKRETINGHIRLTPIPQGQYIHPSGRYKGAWVIDI
jgi:hypothetical protein